MMKTFTLKVLSLLFIVFLLDKPIGFLVSKFNVAKQYDNRIDLIFNKKINQEIIILGSSRAVNCINPKTIEQNTNYSAYNLGFSGSNLNFQEVIFNFLISNSNPKKVILVLDEESSFIRNEKIIFRNDKLSPYLKYNEVLNEYVKHSSKNKLFAKLSWTYRENQNFFNALDYLRNGKEIPDKTTAIDEYGTILFENGISKINYPNREIKINYYDSKFEDEELINSLNRIIRKSKSENIELFLIRLPRFKTKLIGFNDRLDELVDLSKTKLIDLSDLEFGLDFYFDTGHLNEKGATKITQALSEQIN